MKRPVIERKYMRGTLTIKVWYENPSMKCTVSYGLWSIDLPRHIDELWSWIRWVSDFESAKRLYKIITMEVNDMLREYQLEHSPEGLLVEQFNFQPAPENDTVAIELRNYTRILSWATPQPRDYFVDRYVPSMEYLSPDEYEEKRRNWELESWTIYCVLN